MNHISGNYLQDTELETKLKVLTTGKSNSFEDESQEASAKIDKKPSKVDKEANYESSVNEIAKHYKGVLEALGEDTNRQGILKTPERAAKAMMFFTKGYRECISGEKSVLLYIVTVLMVISLPSSVVSTD